MLVTYNSKIEGIQRPSGTGVGMTSSPDDVLARRSTTIRGSSTWYLNLHGAIGEWQVPATPRFPPLFSAANELPSPPRLVFIPNLFSSLLSPHGVLSVAPMSIHAICK